MNVKHTLLSLVFGVISFAGFSQSLKFGHINSADLLQLMPEVKVSDSTLQAYQKSLEDANQQMLLQYQDLIQKYQNDEATLTDAVKEVREGEIKDLEQRIQDFQGGAQDKLQNKKEEIYGPILKKAEDAIKEVAKDNGYSYVFDDSAGGVIYAQPSDDIMALVKKKLGLQ